MGIVVSVTNQKGGVGKTTLVSSLASILVKRGYRVLLLDMDPQRNLDMAAGPDIAIDPNDMESLSMLSVMRGKATLEEAIIHTDIGDLVRSSSLLSSWRGHEMITAEEYRAMRDKPEAVIELLDTRFSEAERIPETHILREHLKPLVDKYDFVFFDTNPSLMLLTMNALYAADYVLVPVFPDDYTRTAVSELWNTIQNINYYEPEREVKVAGIVITKKVGGTILSRQYAKAYAKRAAQMGTILFNTQIRQSVSAGEYTAQHMNLIDYAPKSTSAEDYVTFADEFLGRIQELEGSKHHDLHHVFAEESRRGGNG